MKNNTVSDGCSTVAWMDGLDGSLYGIPVTRVSNGQGELPDLISHSLCLNSKVAVSHLVTKARAAKNPLDGSI